MKFLRLIEDHKHAEIIDYVKNCKCLASYEELALVERGNHEEIMTYITSHYFELKNYLRFLQRGNLNEIRFYISLHGIYYGDPETEAGLHPYLRNIADELVSYLLQKLFFAKHYGMATEEAQVSCYECLIIKSGDRRALRRYLCHAKRPLQPEAKKLFTAKGYTTAEDLLIANLMDAI